jgi:hypothetical protein
VRERSLFPVVAFDLIDNRSADRALEQWGHWLGGCNRPFGRQSWGLTVHGVLAGVAVSASTVNATCGGFERREVVELARLCAHPSHRDVTRVVLRLWRKVAPGAWGAEYWLVRALVSYANAVRHRGDIYRFDGWKKVAEVASSGGGGTWSRPRRPGERKTVWAFELGGVGGGEAAERVVRVGDTPQRGEK